MGAAASIKEALEFLGSDASPAMVMSHKIAYGSIVAIDVQRVGTKDENGAFAQDLTLQFGTVRGACAAPGHNVLEYTVQVENNHSECVRRRHLQPLDLPELQERGICIGPECREVAVEIEWQAGQRFAADLLRREKGHYEVRFKGGEREVLTGVPLAHLHPTDNSTRYDTSPDSVQPDPLWQLDRKIQADIDVKWPIKNRLKEALELLRSQMRPAAAPPLRGPFVGERAFDSEGFPAHPAPLEALKVDGAFVDTWGKFAGKIKFATTYKIGPSYPRMDAWVESVDAAEPLYFHAALPVYAGLICLGAYKNPLDLGPGTPEWVRAEDVALVGIAIYVNGELHPGSFAEPPVEKNGFQKYGHEACHFIPGCASTYMADSAWIGGVFCLAPTEADNEVRDDIYSIAAYHQILREWSRRPHDTGVPSFGPREISLQVNLVLSTNYLANLRQVCSGAVRVTLREQGLAVAYERMRDVQERRLNSEAALHPKRAQKALAEVTFEEGVERRMVEFPLGSQQRVDYPGGPEQADDASTAPAPLKTMRTQLEEQFGIAGGRGTGLHLLPPPPLNPPGAIAQPPGTPAGAGGATPAGPLGSASAPIRGPEAMYAYLAMPGAESKQPPPPRRVGGRSPSPPRRGAFVPPGGASRAAPFGAGVSALEEEPPALRKQAGAAPPLLPPH